MSGEVGPGAPHPLELTHGDRTTGGLADLGAGRPGANPNFPTTYFIPNPPSLIPDPSTLNLSFAPRVPPDVVPEVATYPAMPELPEVETMRRGIAAIVASRIDDVRRPRSRLRPMKITPRVGDLRRRVVGTRIESVRRAGKRVVIVLDSHDRLVFEPRMTGRLLIADPPDREHLRLVLELSGDGPRQLLFWNVRGLGTVHLMSPRRYAQRLGPEKLGPDALGISAELLRERLHRSRREIKVALLDQRALAGIGISDARLVQWRVPVVERRELAFPRFVGARWARMGPLQGKKPAKLAVRLPCALTRGVS